MKSTARRRNSRSLDLSLLILAVATGVNGLENVSHNIPEAVAIGSTVNLTCRYDLQNDILYAVKWYKSGSEFYRYIPKEGPPISVFGNFSHKINTVLSDAHRVVLNDVTPDLEGRYRCEVSTDLPDFHTLLTSGYMHVVGLPEGIPEILVEKQRYAIGETVKANCTVPPSNPAANVSWSINEISLNSTHHRNIAERMDNRSRAYAELDFEITQDSFRNGRLQITCHANVFQLYKMNVTALIDEERPRLASVLGTRDSPHTGSGVAKLTIAHWIILLVSVSSILQCTR
ncbi:uncharacterized protein LOC107039536 [Diachasma alloeum]|uniref:uncharacterized protein LOC107039536 n=1 Tax=Diachasma alloeum TaxID=454923 RepID=UPI00073830ED|nr:uncharacterized protein LOC107039536 [Diachasma alloeum]